MKQVSMKVERVLIPQDTLYSQSNLSSYFLKDVVPSCRSFMDSVPSRAGCVNFFVEVAAGEQNPL